MVACWSSAARPNATESRTFGTTTQALLSLSDWLSGKSVTHVEIESTGEYWKPIYNLLEVSFTVLVVSSQYIKNVLGRKTDVKDAKWIDQLLQHGLLRGSFISRLPQRDLRNLARHRATLAREKVVSQKW